MLFVLIVTIVPFGIGNNMELQHVAVGFLWVGLLISTALTLPLLFQSDVNNGIIEQYVMNHSSCEVFLIGKLLSHWIISALPMVFLGPILVSMLYVPFPESLQLLASLAVGSVGITCLGFTTAALMAGNSRAGGLLMLIVLPLFIPILIFGSIASEKALKGEMFSPEMLLISGLSLFFAAIALFATPYLIKRAVE
jgi:heme exporter protein B